MGISTKVAKRIVQHPDLRMPGNQPGLIVARADAYPEYRVLYYDRPGGPEVVTVMFECQEGLCERTLDGGYRLVEGVA